MNEKNEGQGFTPINDNSSFDESGKPVQPAEKVLEKNIAPAEGKSVIPPLSTLKSKVPPLSEGKSVISPIHQSATDKLVSQAIGSMKENKPKSGAEIFEEAERARSPKDAKAKQDKQKKEPETSEERRRRLAKERREEWLNGTPPGPSKVRLGQLEGGGLTEHRVDPRHPDYHKR